MKVHKKAGRLVAITVAVLFIGLSVGGIYSAWMVERRASEIALKGLGLVETAVAVVDAGVERADNLIATSRTEVREAAGTITTVGARAEENSPVLNALQERLETSLAPRIGQIQQMLAPVRDAVGTIADAVNFLNSVPGMADRAPRLAALDETFDRLEEMAADVRQLRGTLRALVEAKKGEVTAETVATLSALAQRIDTRLGETQANVQGVQGNVDALQVRLDARKSRMLTLFNLAAWLATLMLAWILYCQMVVIRHCRRSAGEGPVA